MDLNASKDHADTTSFIFTPPRTPTAMAISTHKLFSEIQDIQENLSTLPSLAPGGQVDVLLTRLVFVCILPYSAEFTKTFFSICGITELCAKLRLLCATAEGELEKHWTNRIIQGARSGLYLIILQAFVPKGNRLQ
jgi:nicotianamine synthase